MGGEAFETYRCGGSTGFAPVSRFTPPVDAREGHPKCETDHICRGKL